MNILFLGDLFGKAGRKLLAQKFEDLVLRYHIEFSVVNVENAAGGFGVTPAILEELSALPIDVYTTGNHYWDKKEFVDQADQFEHVIRPANYPVGNPGFAKAIRSSPAGVKVAVLQLMGQVFMPPCDNPFHVADRELPEITRQTPVVLVDIHCEATSEKQAMGRYLDGRVSAVLGTHTHVPTADERILPNGTAFQTDIGMSGAYDSIIGFRPDEIIERFRMNTPRKFEVAKRDIRLTGTMVEVNETTGKAERIARIQERVES